MKAKKQTPRPRPLYYRLEKEKEEWTRDTRNIPTKAIMTVTRKARQ